MEAAPGKLAAGFLKRRDVIHHKKAAAMCGDDQVVTGLDELHVIDWHGGEVGFKSGPVAAIIGRIEKAGIGAKHQEAFAVRIFADYARRIVGRKPCRDGSPALTAVMGLERVRLV